MNILKLRYCNSIVIVDFMILNEIFIYSNKEYEIECYNG